MVAVEEDVAGIKEGGVVVEEEAAGIEEGAVVMAVDVGNVAAVGIGDGVVAEDKTCIAVAVADVAEIAAVVSGLGETGSVVEDAVEGLREDSGGREVE